MSDLPHVDFEAYKARAEKTAMEAMHEIFHRLPWETEIVLSDGRVGMLKKFIAPRICHRSDDSHQGRPEFGFDLRAKDGSWHLEFFCYQTGWGMAP